MRRGLVVGNWKMHGSRASVDALLGSLLRADAAQGAEAAVCPTYVHLAQALGLCAGSSLAVGAQDCSHMQSGAYTGEVAAEMLAELGCRWVILGHSERRQYHGESDDLVAAKLAAAVEAGLQPIVCVGETREQREAGEAEAVVAAQLQGALADQADLVALVVAYEPVWAIGTGLTATSEQAQDMHAFIRGCLVDIDAVDAAAIRLLYGGSVKATNAAQLFAQPDIDGALVGGAALVAEEFQAIIDAAAAAAQ
ncbi:MAG: triose-phosphate isomerase [Gammaproteobacteria bacterium]|nr:MAG: triose-phosphate isomerase [Gammaproteobacteria bacterium]